MIKDDNLQHKSRPKYQIQLNPDPNKNSTDPQRTPRRIEIYRTHISQHDKQNLTSKSQANFVYYKSLVRNPTLPGKRVTRLSTVLRIQPSFHAIQHSWHFYSTKLALFRTEEQTSPGGEKKEKTKICLPHVLNRDLFRIEKANNKCSVADPDPNL